MATLREVSRRAERTPLWGSYVTAYVRIGDLSPRAIIEINARMKTTNRSILWCYAIDRRILGLNRVSARTQAVFHDGLEIYVNNQRMAALVSTFRRLLLENVLKSKCGTDRMCGALKA